MTTTDFTLLHKLSCDDDYEYASTRSVDAVGVETILGAMIEDSNERRRASQPDPDEVEPASEPAPSSDRYTSAASDIAEAFMKAR